MALRVSVSFYLILYFISISIKWITQNKPWLDYIANLRYRITTGIRFRDEPWFRHNLNYLSRVAMPPLKQHLICTDSLIVTIAAVFPRPCQMERDDAGRERAVPVAFFLPLGIQNVATAIMRRFICPSLCAFCALSVYSVGLCLHKKSTQAERPPRGRGL